MLFVVNVQIYLHPNPENQRILAGLGCGKFELLMLVAAIFFIPVFIEYLQTGLVNRFPTLIVSGFIMIAAIQAMFSGLLLENLRHAEKHNFENRLHDIYARKKELLSTGECSGKEENRT